MDKVHDVIIIGLGISGIHLGRKLEKKNQSYLIIEKSRNTGGRFANRRFDDVVFNFGARSFEWDGSFFREEVDIGLTMKHLELKSGEIKPVNSFNDWTKCLAKDLNVKRSTVVEVSKDKLFTVTLSDGSTLRSKKLVSTAPAEQAYLLLNSICDLSVLKEAEYEKHMYYMFSHHSSDISHKDLEIIDKKREGNKYYYHCRVLRSWSDSSRESLKEDFDSIIRPLDSFAHKWKFARISKSIDLFSPQIANLHLVGDYFGYNGVLSSFKSCEFVSNYI